MGAETLTLLDALGKTIAAAIEKSQHQGGGGGKGRRSFEERHLRRVDKYNGAGSWSDWAFTLKAAALSCDKATVEVMDWVESNDKVDSQILEDDLVDSEVVAIGFEVFDVLAGLTAGEAISAVRGTEGMNGFVA